MTAANAPFSVTGLDQANCPWKNLQIKFWVLNAALFTPQELFDWLLGFPGAARYECRYGFGRRGLFALNVRGSFSFLFFYPLLKSFRKRLPVGLGSCRFAGCMSHKYNLPAGSQCLAYDSGSPANPEKAKMLKIIFHYPVCFLPRRSDSVVYQIL